ncbi:MAG: extracellular solute-binding protein [Opitutaceae bacterium]|nr:extracellular solute-binding protein [Opitutaceae bacterium]
MPRFSLKSLPQPVLIAFISAVSLTLLWLLSPSRSVKVSAPGVVEISYMGPGGAISGALDDAIRAFEEESRRAHAADPSRPIYRVISGQNASRGMTGDPTRFLLSVAGGMPPDVIYFDRFAVAEWSARGAFADLTPFIQRDIASGHPDAVRPEDYYRTTWDEIVFTHPVSGSTGVFGIPDAFESRALIYNKDALRRAGFVDAAGNVQPPATWEELEKISLALTERDAAGRINRLGFAPYIGADMLYLYGWQNGAELLDPTGRQITVNSPAFAEALQWSIDFLDRLGGVKNVQAFTTTNQTGDLDPFVIGRIGMKFDGFWAVQWGLAQYGDRVDYGVAPPPMPARALAEGRPPASWIGGWCYAIPTASSKQDAAWELIRFLASPRARAIVAESQRLAAQSQGRTFVPTQSAHRLVNERNFEKYIYANPAIDPKLKQAVRVFNDVVPEARFRPATPVGQLLFNETMSATEAAAYGALSPQAALDRAAANSQRELDQVLAPPRGAPVNWSYFGWLYGTLVLGGAFALYKWDTSAAWRLAVHRALVGLRLARADDRGGILEGAGGGIFRGQWLGGFLCAFPWILGFLVFTGGPILFSIIISFADYDVLRPASWAGLANYTRMFGGDDLFLVSVGNTAFMMLGIPVGMAVSLGIALLLNVEIKGIAVWRTCFYLPSIVPAVASSILWIWIFNPSNGLINSVLESFGITGPNWLQDPRTSKPALILMGLWGAGGGMLIWLAGLKAISESYYEAARIDGATTWQQFKHITLPMLSPYIFFNLIMGVIGTLQVFSQAFIMTQGGPVNSTMFFAYHLFNHAFRYLNMGYASALAWVLLVVVLLLTLLQFKLSKRWVHYEGD